MNHLIKKLTVLPLYCIGLLVAGCNNPSGDSIPDHQQRLAMIHTEHLTLSSSFSVRPDNAGLAPITSPDNLTSFSSRAKTNGSVVGTADLFVPVENGDYVPVKYVTFTFLSDDAVASGGLVNGSTQTEVWRYSNARWCPVVVNAPTANGSLKGLTKLATVQTDKIVYDRASSTASVYLFMGMADGTLAKLAFNDTNPLSSDCNTFDLASGENSFYTPLAKAMASEPVTGIKLAQIQDSFAGDSLTDYDYLYHWGGATSCDATTNPSCHDYQTSPLQQLLLKNNQVVVESQRVVNLDQTLRRSANTRVNDFDARVSRGLDGQWQFIYAASYQTPGFLEEGASIKSYVDVAVINRPASATPFLPLITREEWNTGLGVLDNGNNLVPDVTQITQVSISSGINANGLIEPQLKLHSNNHRQANATCSLTMFECRHEHLLHQSGNSSRSGQLKSFIPQASLNGLNTALWQATVYAYTGGAESLPTLNLIISNGAEKRETNAVFPVGSYPATGWLTHSDLTKNSPKNAFQIGSVDFFINRHESKNYVNILVKFENNLHVGDGDALEHGGVFQCSMAMDNTTSDTSLFNRVNSAFSECFMPYDEQKGYGYKSAIPKEVYPASYMTAPHTLKVSADPNGRALITYTSLAGAIAIVDASNPSLSNQMSWTTLSKGRPAECHQTLSKPVPNLPSDNLKWWQRTGIDLLDKLVVKGTSGAVSAGAGPITGFVAGMVVDKILHSVENKYVPGYDKDKTTQAEIDGWKTAYQNTKLSTVCSVQ